MKLFTGKAEAQKRAATPPEDIEQDNQYEPVTGLDVETVQCVRACEAIAADKTASDYEHVVWAYGVIWSLFAVYGVLLWRRAQRQQGDLAELQRRLDAARGK